MTKIIALFFSLLIALPLFAANDGRAIRSNWPCMDAVANCVGLEFQSISFKVTMRFRHGHYALSQPLYLEATINGTSQQIEVTNTHYNNSAAAFTALIGYTTLGQPRYGYVNDVEFNFVFPMTTGTPDFDYKFTLVDDDGNPFDIASYPTLMAMFDPPTNLLSYTVDSIDEITEEGNKDICPNLNCGLSSRLNQSNTLTDQLTTFPNPFNNQVTVNYITETDNNSTVIEVLDIQGKTIQQLIQNDEAAGQQQAVLETADLSSGVYFARISNADGVQTVKLVKQME